MECKSNEDGVKNRGDHLGIPPNTQRYHLKDLSYLKRGGFRDKKKREGNLSTCCLKRRKHLKFLVHRFVLFCLFLFFKKFFCRSYIFKVYIL